MKRQGQHLSFHIPAETELPFNATIVYMRTDKNTAFQLRKEGKSYREIAENLGVSKSTLSNWFKGVDFSEAIRVSLTKRNLAQGAERIHTLNKTRGDALSATYAFAREEALLGMKKYANDPLFVAAIVAYWGEGDKLSKNQVRITNTDPLMLALFRTFLLKICKIPENKIRGAIFIYDDLDVKACTRYWSENTGMTMFHKAMVLPGRHKTRRLQYGTCTLVVSNTYLKEKIRVWIDQLPKMLLNRGSNDIADIV